MITLICGHPRAGKTTYSAQYGDAVLHLDECGMQPYEGVEKRIRHMVGDVVVEGVYSRAHRRKRLLSLYKGGGKATCIWLDTPLEVRRQRVGYHRTLSERFEPPTYQEGWDEIIVLRGGGE